MREVGLGGVGVLIHVEVEQKQGHGQPQDSQRMAELRAQVHLPRVHRVILRYVQVHQLPYVQVYPMEIII